MNARRVHLVAIVFAAVAVTTLAGFSYAEEPISPSINYMSSDAVYLNVGRQSGLAIGARVEVVRAGRTVAVLEVVHVSSQSASCRIVEQTEAPRVGDAVTFSPVAAAPLTPAPAPAAASSYQRDPTVNVVSGYIEFQTVWQQDLSSSEVSSLVPAIAARIRVKNVGNTGGDIRFRDRVRYYYRNLPPGDDIDSGQWYHRLTEMAYVVDDNRARLHWGVGRFVAPYMIGVGLVDGGYLSVAFAKYFRAGAAGGLAPDLYDMSLDSESVQAGGFLALDYESLRRWRVVSAASLTGRYVSGTVSREFVYWQNIFNLYRRFSFYQSVEIDLNRDWRRDVSGEDVTFSNFYVTANAEVSSYVSLDFTYDSRKNFRIYETKETPDSLFDDLVHDGYRGGLTLRLPYGVNLGGNGGLRYRDGLRTNRYVSVYARAAQLPWQGHSFWVRYAYAETRIVTGHRPNVSYRFPIGRKLRLDAGAGGYIFNQGTRTTSSFYGDFGAYYTFGRYFTSGSYRQYFGGDLDSILLFAEIGLRL